MIQKCYCDDTKVMPKGQGFTPIPLSLCFLLQPHTNQPNSVASMVFYKGLVGRIEVWEYKDRFWGVLLRHLALLPILHPPPPTSKTQVRWLGPLLGPISSLCVQTASFLLHRRDWDQQYINMRLLEGDLRGGVHFVKWDKINQHRKSTKFSSTKTLDIIHRDFKKSFSHILRFCV